jgi:hypothetical protein
MAKRSVKNPVEIEKVRTRVLRNGVNFDPQSYEVDDTFTPWSGANPLEIHSVQELIEAAKKGTIEVDAKVIGYDAKKRWGFKRLDTKAFTEACAKNGKRSFKEAADLFAYDLNGGQNYVGGQDFTPLLGGPFNKQLYYYDYLRMHSLAFYAYHHDPIAKAIVSITRDFVLGRGVRVDIKDPKAQAIWDAFAKVNNLDRQLELICDESSIYGENMIWWLPDNDTKIGYQLRGDQAVPKGYLPRFRLIDPSVIWEIVTYPEDITRVLYYQWVAPTQYQLYTDGTVPTAKFIYQQIPANQVDHFKINCVSNEKRGRSDFFPALGYMKRLREAVDYQIIAMQKQAAWAIDTSIEGSQQDVDGYVQAMEQMGTIPPAGSEFAHTSKIKREMISPAGGNKGQQAAFEWCLSMICASVQIPTNYMGTHMSGGAARASAVVATEPVAKKFQMRQLYMERVILKMGERLSEKFGLDFDMEVTFPELISQDRSAKLKDLALAESQRWVSNETAAEIAAKEFGITSYKYAEEIQRIAQDVKDLPPPPMPLTQPGMAPQDDIKSSAITSDERSEITQNARS